MNNLLLTVSICILSLSVTARAEDASLKTDSQKTLYALGAMVGSQVAQNLASLSLSPKEMKFVSLGLQDSLRGHKPRVDLAAYAPKVQGLAKARQEANATKEKAQAEKEKIKAKSFADKASKEKGAVEYPSGLVYIPIKEGAGASPKDTDVVRVHYHGTMIDGKVFDSSVQRGQPAEFSLNQVIPCWTEGVQKMKVGGKAKLICPSQIAYGDQGRPPQIPGGATLIFEVQLLDIVKKEAK